MHDRLALIFVRQVYIFPNQRNLYIAWFLYPVQLIHSETSRQQVILLKQFKNFFKFFNQVNKYLLGMYLNRLSIASCDSQLKPVQIQKAETNKNISIVLI